jgi:hypothetical protein
MRWRTIKGAFYLVTLFLSCVLCLYALPELLFRGIVLDPNASPVDGASISLKGTHEIFEAKADATGQFAFAEIPDGIYDIEVSERGFETKTIKNFRICPPNRLVRIFLSVGPVIPDNMIPRKGYKAGDRLEGTVEDELGAVISNASLILVSAKKTFRTKSDSHGRFSFSQVRPGQYQLTVSADSFQIKTIQNITITPQDSPGLRIVLDSPRYH